MEIMQQFHSFSQIFYMNRVETCMYKCMGLYRKLTLCFVNMLNYGILWAPFLLKTLLEESPPAGARHVQRTVPGAPLLILENFCCCLSRSDLSPLGLQGWTNHSKD